MSNHNLIPISLYLNNMQIEDRTYYEEEQKMESKWILILILVMSLSSLVIAVAVLYSSKAELYLIGIVAGAILFSDALVIFLFKAMKLEIALTKKGFCFKMSPSGNKNKCVDWSEVSAICIRKSPASGYGKKQKFRYGVVYAMNLKPGLELSLTNGKKKFFSLKDPDEFKKAFRKLELPLIIE